MSTTTILSAINFNATAAAEKNRTTGAAVALFKKGGKEVNTSEKALGRDCLKGITAEQYETYCKAVRAVYLDADLLARYAADADSVQFPSPCGDKLKSYCPYCNRTSEQVSVPLRG